MTLKLTADSSHTGLRLDSFLSGCCKNLSRSYIQKLIKSGEVFVNGKAAKASLKMEEGDSVSLEIPEASARISAVNTETDMCRYNIYVIDIIPQKAKKVHELFQFSQKLLKIVRQWGGKFHIFVCSRMNNS